ncbi:MAG: aminopeptidase P N-terminal domain-containing protein, partial [Bacteroidota bacterium]
MKTIQIIPVLIFMVGVWFMNSNTLMAQEEDSYLMNQKRRQQLMQEMGDGMAVMMGAPVKKRNGDGNYPYRQRSSFYYLTGFKQPHSAFIIQPGEEYE